MGQSAPSTTCSGWGSKPAPFGGEQSIGVVLRGLFFKIEMSPASRSIPHRQCTASYRSYCPRMSMSCCSKKSRAIAPIEPSSLIKHDAQFGARLLIQPVA